MPNNPTPPLRPIPPIPQRAKVNRDENLSLITAHLLGGTSGLNLSASLTDEEISTLVSVAVRVAREIERQVAQL